MLVSATDNRPPVRGVIDTVSAGFRLASRHPWLVAIPAGLDMALWLGPRLGVGQLLLDLLRQATPPADLGADYLAAFESTRQVLTEMSGQINLAGLLSANFLGVPTLLGTGALGRDLLETPPMVIELGSWAALGFTAVVLTLLSVWIGAVYLAGLANAVRQAAPDPRALAADTWFAGWRLTVWLALQAAAALFLGIPAMALVGVVMFFNVNAASFIMGLAWLVIMWVAIYLFFVVPSVAVGQAGAFRSMWNSLNVVRWNLGAALGLIVLVSLLQRGMPLAWEALAAEPALMPLCIIGNAYIGTGLMAACLIFYRERYAIWQTWLNAQRIARAAKGAGPAANQARGSR
jgi:hypothetical protein